MLAKAHFKYVRMTPRKVRAVLDLVRGKGLVAALGVLQLTRRRAKDVVVKILKSAVDGAVKTKNMREDKLFIQSCWVDGGPAFRRWQPRAQGRANIMKKRMCHVTVVLGEKS